MKCQYPKCRRNVRRDGRCIFHLPGKNAVEAKEFFKQVLLLMSKAERAKTSAGFQGFIFPGWDFDYMGDTGLEFKSGADFSDAVFEEDAFFDMARFGGDTVFEGVRFCGYAFFGEAKFEGHAFFSMAMFDKDARFFEVGFDGHAWFDDSKFAGKAEFRGATFRGEAGFSGVTFSGDATFDRATFSGALSVFNVPSAANFEMARFGNVTFRESVFIGETQMRAYFGGIALFERALFQRDSIEPNDLAHMTDPSRLTCLALTRFEGASVGTEGEVRFIQPEDRPRKDVDINQAIDRVSFLNVDLSRFNFQDVLWGTYLGRKAIIEEILVRKGLFARNIRPQQVRQVYARLRENHERALRYAEAGDFFVGEMEMRKLDLKAGREHLPPPQRFPEWLLLSIYKHLAMYGESISRPICWIIFAVIFFALVRLSLTSSRDIATVQDSLMQSLMAFFQMRSEPGVDIIERLVSIPVLGTLFVVVRRKFERRS